MIGVRLWSKRRYAENISRTQSNQPKANFACSKYTLKSHDEFAKNIFAFRKSAKSGAMILLQTTLFVTSQNHCEFQVAVLKSKTFRCELLRCRQLCGFEVQINKLFSSCVLLCLVKNNAVLKVYICRNCWIYHVWPCLQLFVLFFLESRGIFFTCEITSNSYNTHI